MNEIKFPLSLGMKGQPVADLHLAVRNLLERGVLFRDDPGGREEAARALEAEFGENTYGKATRKLVGLFQEQRQLQPTGEVDAATARSLNSLLREWGLLAGDKLPRAFVVSGRVQRNDDLPIAGARVNAVHENERGTIRLGEDTTDADGRYTIRYEPVPELSPLRLRVLVMSAQGKPLLRSEVISEPRPVEQIDLKQGTGAPSTPSRLEGRVVFARNQPAENLSLRLYRRDFGGKTTLLESISTRAGGQYAFTYDPASKAVSLEIRAVAADGGEIPLSRALTDVGKQSRTIVNLVAPAALQVVAPEYRRLSEDLQPLVGGLDNLATSQENDQRQDLTLLNRATGWDARLIALAATAQRLGTDPEVKLSGEALYGLLRAGLPSDKALLAQVDPKVAADVLANMQKDGIVQLTAPELAGFQKQFASFATQVRLGTTAPGSKSTYRQLLRSSTIEEDAQNRFATVYLHHRGDAAALWDDARKAGLVETQIARLQVQGKLAFLTGSSEPLTAQLQRSLDGKDPSQLVDHELYREDRWVEEIHAAAGIPAERREALNAEDRKRLETLIPSSFTGDTVEKRRDFWAHDMARKVRLSYPTEVLGHQIASGAGDALNLGANRGATAKVLKNAAAQGYKLGQTPVNAFFEQHPGFPEDVSQEQFALAKKDVKTLHRLYQITPSNEAMQVLVSLGITSAYDVTAYTEASFIEGFGPRFPSEREARMVYRKATQVTNITYNLFAMGKAVASQPNLFVASPSVAVQQSSANELIKHFPTMSALFGSVDFCECEHCRSVLSPAAYLVDLLQFIEAEPQVWANFLHGWTESHQGQKYTDKYSEPYQALMDRRPDLANIPLTCENTKTALPYIDLVNEILEFFVAHGSLEAEAANDTGELTSAELLAEPQNVIALAYDQLRKARYPLGLPFDLWLETVRGFCRHFSLPLPELLETFRGSDDLFAAKRQPYDRAAIFLEKLGLSPAEAAVFRDPNPLATWHELYGYPSAQKALTAAVDAETGERLDLNSAKALSRRLGVTYQELLAIVQTEFVNPALRKLVLLKKLNLSIKDVRDCRDQNNRDFFAQNQDLLDKKRETLSRADQKRFDQISAAQWETMKEIQSFLAKLAKFAAQYSVPVAELETELATIPFNRVLVLADPDVGCNFDQTLLQYADGHAAEPIDFLKINLLVRLWRKLGWTLAEVNRALAVFIPASAPFVAANFARRPLETALFYLSHLDSLEKALSLGKAARLKLLTFWADLDTFGRDSLYLQLFVNRAILKSDDVFDHPLGHYLSPAAIKATADRRRFWVEANVAPANRIDPGPLAAFPKIQVQYDELEEVQKVGYLGELVEADKTTLLPLSTSPAWPGLLDAVQTAAREFRLIKGHLTALQGALGLRPEEIGRILEDAGQSLGNAVLSLANVSLLHRYAVLAKGLRLSVADLISLRQLSGLDPFKPLHPQPLGAIGDNHPFTQTLRFLDMAAELKASGLGIADLDFLLRHKFDPNGKRRPDQAGTAALLRSLAQGIRNIRTENAVPEDPGVLSDELLRGKLGLVLPAEVVERFLAMCNGSVEFTATRTAVGGGDALLPAAFEDEPTIPEVRYNSLRQEQKLTFRGVLFDAQKTELLARLPRPTPPAPHTPSPLLADLLDSVQAQARAFFDQHLLRQPADAQPGGGFLAAADFTLLFGPSTATTDAEQQAHIRAQRRRLAEAFFPFLQERLTRQLVIATMISATGGDPALVEALIAEDRLLTVAGPGSGRSLLSAFSDLGGRGLTATFHASTDGTGPALVTALAREPDTTVRDEHGARLRPAGARSASFSGYLEVQAAGAYRFTLALDKLGAAAELRFDHLPDPVLWSGIAASDGASLGDRPAEYLELKAGVPYRFTLELRNLGSGEARLSVQGETLPRQSLASLSLYPLAAVEAAEQANLLLGKVLELVQSLSLSQRELRYLLAHAVEFGDLSLSTLPTKVSADPAADVTRFGHFLRLAGYTRLRRDMAGGGDGLIAVFEANQLGDLELVYQRVADLTRRSLTTVRATAKSLSPAPAFGDELAMRRLWDGLRAVEQLGVEVGALAQWTRIVNLRATEDQRFAIARALKEALRARFTPEGWQKTARPIFDDLRKRQRDALVAFISDRKGFRGAEELYQYFLVDPAMEPVVQTSRIRLAIASVQLFIQRCLLNLEKDVHPSALINAEQWEWMKRYRVWEANRKIFLYPENFLEPEFRDQKSHLYTELENALFEGDVSSDLVEDAFLRYLRGLEDLARLDIVAMHLETHDNAAENTLHVIGCPFESPPKHFYRRYALGNWTPWEPINLDIESRHLAPVIWRDRLYLFWVTFIEKAVEDRTPPSFDPNQQVPIPALQTVLEAQLHWSEYLDGDWSTPRSGPLDPPRDQKMVAAVPAAGRPFVFVSKEPRQGDEDRGVFIHLGPPFNKSFFLAGRNSPPAKSAVVGVVPGTPLDVEASTPDAARYHGSGGLSVRFDERVSTTQASGRPQPRKILGAAGTYTLVPCNNDFKIGEISAATIEAEDPAAVARLINSGLKDVAALMKPAFFQDEINTFFLEPTVTERTVEDWQEWVTPADPPEPDWQLPEWWREVVVVPYIPRPLPVPVPDDPVWRPEIDPRSVLEIERGQDWLVNAGTGLLFNGTLVGPYGGEGLKVVTVADGKSTGGTVITVNGGSHVAPGTSVVVQEGATLETVGFAKDGPGINVVGGSGFSSTLKRNLGALEKSFGSSFTGGVP